jgi:hypothetical protein
MTAETALQKITTKNSLINQLTYWQSLDRQFEPYPRANTVAPSWCGLGCRSRTLMVEYISPWFYFGPSLILGSMGYFRESISNAQFFILHCNVGPGLRPARFSSEPSRPTRAADRHGLLGKPSRHSRPTRRAADSENRVSRAESRAHPEGWPDSESASHHIASPVVAARSGHGHCRAAMPVTRIRLRV